MKPDPAFLSMRAGLVQRGLLTGDFRLTSAGHAHAEALIEQLQAGEQADGRWNPPVRWNVKRQGHIHG